MNPAGYNRPLSKYIIQGQTKLLRWMANIKDRYGRFGHNCILSWKIQV